MKDYFKFKKGYYKVLKDLSDKQAGEIIKGIGAYVFEGKPFVTKDDYLKGLFMCAQRELDQLRRDSENGMKGAKRAAELRQLAKSENVCVGRIVVGGGDVGDFLKDLLSTIGGDDNDGEGNK